MDENHFVLCVFDAAINEVRQRNVFENIKQAQEYVRISDTIWMYILNHELDFSCETLSLVDKEKLKKSIPYNFERRRHTHNNLRLLNCLYAMFLNILKTGIISETPFIGRSLMQTEFIMFFLMRHCALLTHPFVFDEVFMETTITSYQRMIEFAYANFCMTWWRYVKQKCPFIF